MASHELYPVVSANAGTHTARSIDRAMWLTPCRKSMAGG
jgi:hypothetical protein